MNTMQENEVIGNNRKKQDGKYDKIRMAKTRVKPKSSCSSDKCLQSAQREVTLVILELQSYCENAVRHCVTEA